MNKKHIILTVSNDLVYDQRMRKIATSLAHAGYKVTLAGRCYRNSAPLTDQVFKQIRLRLFFKKGPAFYMEMNLRLFFWLLFKKADIICAVDLDTILPCLLVSVIKKTKRVYDAHELFTEQKEIVTRPVIRSIWKLIERIAVPYFKTAYTVNKFIADKLSKQYGNRFFVIRNMPVYYEHHPSPDFGNKRFFIYQGAVNHGRSFETLIPAMQFVNAKLVICGTGNFFEEAKALISHYHLEEKIEMRGNLLPADLRTLTCNAYAGITIFEPVGLNQVHSLCNRFFDYIMAEIPQVCCDYPEYKNLNKIHEVARLTGSVEISDLAIALNHLLNDEKYYFELKENCRHAKEDWNWETEETHLINIYSTLN